MSPDKQLIDLVIIIPTLNEEHFVGYLLDSIAHQSVLPKEIMVVDAYSKDKTIKEIKKRKKYLPQLRYHQIPRSTISKQRNFAASKTKSEHILFLDADMMLKDQDLLKKYLAEVKMKRVDMAASTNIPSTNYWKDNLFFAGMDILYRIIKPIWPMANGMNLYIKRSIFNKSGGFDEEVVIGEDHELVQRIVRMGGRFIFLNDTKLHTSARRYVKEGRRRFIFKMVKSFFHVIRFGYKNNMIEYELGNFKQSNR